MKGDGPPYSPAAAVTLKEKEIRAVKVSRAAHVASSYVQDRLRNLAKILDVQIAHIQDVLSGAVSTGEEYSYDYLNALLSAQTQLYNQTGLYVPDSTEIAAEAYAPLVDLIYEETWPCGTNNKPFVRKGGSLGNVIGGGQYTFYSLGPGRIAVTQAGNYYTAVATPNSGAIFNGWSKAGVTIQTGPNLQVPVSGASSGGSYLATFSPA